MTAQTRSAIDEWRAGWPLTLAGVVGMATVSIHAYSLGVMIAPIEAEFGWTRATITSGLLILSIVGVLFNVPMGMVIDRFGARPVALTGLVTYCTAIALLSRASGSVALWYLLWLLVALGQLQLKPTTWVAPITRAFERHRGLALAVVLSGTGLATFSVPIVTQALVSSHGWQQAYLLLGAWGVIAVPLVWLFFREPHRRRGAASGPAQRTADLPGYTFREGIRTRAFVQLSAAVVIFALGSTALVLNLVPILQSRGLDAGTAAAFAGSAGVATVVGRLSSGYLLDRFDARVVSGLVVLLPIATSLLLMTLPGPLWIAFVAVIALGLAGGAEMDAVAYMAGRYFGLRSLGALFGAMMSCMTLGVGLGPVLASYAYDVTGSYGLALWAEIPLCLIAAWLFYSNGRYPDFSPTDD